VHTGAETAESHMLLLTPTPYSREDVDIFAGSVTHMWIKLMHVGPQMPAASWALLNRLMLLSRNLKEAGSAGLAVDPSKIVWTPYHAEREYANYRG